MNPKISELRELVSQFPTQSGVYLMRNEADKILYVGKAKNLRNRVRSYFHESQDHRKTVLLVQQIRQVEYILTKTEVEAFLLEASLIKKHRPKYNIRLKDDKAYPYIKLSWSDAFPRLYLARKVRKDGGMYFGPYTSGGAVFGTIRFLNRTFKIRDCTDAVFKNRKRPCITHQIGRCTAPCTNYISQEDYKSEVEGALLFLRGQNKKVIKALTEKMMTMASEEKFEVAARLRDSIQAIKSIQEKQAVINDTSEKDQDVVGYFGDERGTVIETLHIRQGRVVGVRPHYLPNLNTLDSLEDPRDWMVSFLNQYYDENIVPDEVLLPIDLGRDLTKLLEAVLKERSGRDCYVRIATDNKGRSLEEMAHENAKAQFEKWVSKSEEKKRGLEEIQERLGLPKLPRRIECYDISNFQGGANVASQVVFEDGIPASEHYRRYKIKSVEGQNDFASMYEVLSRRFQHTEYDDPDLIVIDGGKGQLAQALKILEEIGRREIPVVGLAKARTESDFQASDVKSSEERVFLPGRSNPVILRTTSEAHHILVGIRDEAHRFAINYHRKLRDDQTMASELDLVTGLGEHRKRQLLGKFGSVQHIREADPEEIAQMKGFNRVLAERILLQLHHEENEPEDEGAS
ncbi:MAG: excinuclease ABC subunit UvrC [Bdellovibrionales bacterium]